MAGAPAAYAQRGARRLRAFAGTGLDRLRQRSVIVAQCAVASAIAWAVAQFALGHEQPFFAPVAAMITLGMSFGQRLRRALDVLVGVTVGIFVGDLVVHLFGSGVWQVLLVVLLAMSVAVLLGAGTILATQAGVQGAVVLGLLAQPATAVNRWLDALVGGSIALVVAAVAPAGPLTRPRDQAASIAGELAAVLLDTATALRSGDVQLAGATLGRARGTEHSLEQLRTLSAEGIDVVRLSPFRRGHLPSVLEIAGLVEPLDRAARNVRVLVRRAAVAVLDGEQVPPAYAALVASLGVATAGIAAGLQDQRPLAEQLRDALVRVAEDSSHTVAHPTLSAEVIRAQVRSTVVDLLMLTGLSYDRARSLVPTSEDASEGVDAGEREADLRDAKRDAHPSDGPGPAGSDRCDPDVDDVREGQA